MFSKKENSKKILNTFKKVEAFLKQSFISYNKTIVKETCFLFNENVENHNSLKHMA